MGDTKKRTLKNKTGLMQSQFSFWQTNGPTCSKYQVGLTWECAPARRTRARTGGRLMGAGGREGERTHRCQSHSHVKSERDAIAIAHVDGKVLQRGGQCEHQSQGHPSKIRTICSQTGFGLRKGATHFMHRSVSWRDGPIGVA